MLFLFLIIVASYLAKRSKLLLFVSFPVYYLKYFYSEFWVWVFRNIHFRKIHSFKDIKKMLKKEKWEEILGKRSWIKKPPFCDIFSDSYITAHILSSNCNCHRNLIMWITGYLAHTTMFFIQLKKRNMFEKNILFTQTLQKKPR